jgi:molecular chaperone DnaK (HSP70)
LLTTTQTYSCVAIYEGTNVEIIANEQGSFTTPSFVSFNEKERLIGEAAKNQAAMNAANTIFDVKYVDVARARARIDALGRHAD